MNSSNEKYKPVFSKTYSYPPHMVSLNNSNKNAYVYSPINNYVEVFDSHGKVIDLIDISNKSMTYDNSSYFKKYSNMRMCPINE